MTVVNCDKRDCRNNSKNKEKFPLGDGVCTCEEIQVEDQGSGMSCNSYDEVW